MTQQRVSYDDIYPALIDALQTRNLQRYREIVLRTAYLNGVEQGPYEDLTIDVLEGFKLTHTHAHNIALTLTGERL